MNSRRASSSCARRTRIRSNASASSPSSSPPRVHDRLVEAPAGDPVGRALEPADAAREDRGAAVAEQRARQQRHAARGEQEAPLDELDVRERVAERRRQEQHVPLLRVRARPPRRTAPRRADRAVLQAAGRRRAQIAIGSRCDVGRRAASRRVRDRREQRRQRERGRSDDDPGVRAREASSTAPSSSAAGLRLARERSAARRAPAARRRASTSRCSSDGTTTA